WSRPESVTARSGDGCASANALHGIRGILGCICVCDFCADWREIGCDVGALVAAMDHSGLDVSDLRDRAGKFLGLLRTWLGRLVVLGPGRERFVHALAGWHGADSLIGGYRKAGRFQELDR